MALVRTLVLTPNFDVVRESVTFTNVTPFETGGNLSLYNRAQRPLYRFTLKLEPLLRWAMEDLQAFHAFHQGGKSFFYDGGPYAQVEDFRLFGEGNGGQRQFYLPNRYVGAGSLAVQTQNQATGTTSLWTATYSLNPTIGLVTFNPSTATTPNSGHDVMAKWACKYRVRFDGDGFKESEFAKNIYKVELKLEELLLFT
jgi:hypothetical protein